jgi:hypothetical protein
VKETNVTHEEVIPAPEEAMAVAMEEEVMAVVVDMEAEVTEEAEDMEEDTVAEEVRLEDDILVPHLEEEMTHDLLAQFEEETIRQVL